MRPKEPLVFYDPRELFAKLSFHFRKNSLPFLTLLVSKVQSINLKRTKTASTASPVCKNDLTNSRLFDKMSTKVFAEDFNLTKSELCDGIALRKGWEPRHLPVNCSCGKTFSISHALHCAKGGNAHMRHDANRDTFANIIDDVCYNVKTEPLLQPLQGESQQGESQGYRGSLYPP